MLNDDALDYLFREARTQNAWKDNPVSEDKLHEIYDLLKWGPTSANCFPQRIIFCHSQEAKDELATMVMDGNKPKVKDSAATAILAFDLEFYEKIPELFPHAPEAREWFANDEDAAFENAFRNGTLQGAYFIMAARALGLGCGPMSGFDQDAVNKHYFPDGKWKSNFLCAIGTGDPEAIFPRSPRPAFDDVCTIL